MIRAIITDIEGTTSSISFVKEVLFPYAFNAMEGFLEENWPADFTREAVAQAATESGLTLDTPQAASALFRQWIEEDRKSTPLKSLQGHIWKAGYQNGDYRAHLYPDTAPALRRWKDQGLDLYVYSSGSIAAQKLFFGYSEAGDITNLFSGYFDTTTGPKQETASYQAIAQSIGVPASELLFLSDIGAELDAAQAAGFQTVQLIRDEIAVPSDKHPQVTSFDAITLDR